MDIKLPISYLNIPRLFPHIFLFLRKRQLFRDDILANYRGVTRGLFNQFLILLVFKKSYRNIFYHRVGRISFTFRWMLPEDGSFILDREMTIGKGMCAGHPFATTVNAKSAGRNFSVYQNVTIGVNNGGKPIIGHNVSVYSHSIVIGNIIIGDNVTIGAGSVVCKDVPSGCTVVGNPARIIYENGNRINKKL